MNSGLQAIITPPVGGVQRGKVGPKMPLDVVLGVENTVVSVTDPVVTPVVKGVVGMSGTHE